jgi:hypothetical protein
MALESSWPGLARPSTSLPEQDKQDVDARHKAGHDGRDGMWTRINWAGRGGAIELRRE